jgi:hypothetical protein
VTWLFSGYFPYVSSLSVFFLLVSLHLFEGIAILIVAFGWCCARFACAFQIPFVASTVVGSSAPRLASTTQDNIMLQRYAGLFPKGEG